ncbi:MAG: type II toxin-antitoxin system VapC family toxin [Chthonomonadaceae bacterium]|nr:type II toxin-antitoxin system VapC family toxin [Chthonomonadaceae bacterium]
MPYLLWDASALAKRYTPEAGSDVVEAFFNQVEASCIITTIWGYSETFPILLRRYNGGMMRREAFIGATSSLRSEIIESLETGVLTIDDTTIVSSLDVMQKHNLNSTDAAILTLFLHFASATEEPCVLIAADKRLVRSANAEGLKAVDPEVFAVEDVAAYLSSL